jgi:catechol 2,3-dioxygenase-like lactoylglutathione lyase family enzyme
MMPQRLSLTALLVDDYDDAIAFYVGSLGFELREDTVVAEAKRWVVVAPPGGASGLLLARAVDDRQRLETDDFVRDYEGYINRGVRFSEPPRHEPYGTVAVFEDPYGNRWDLIQPVREDGPA